LTSATIRPPAFSSRITVGITFPSEMNDTSIVAASPFSGSDSDILC
jgi:hypothetical protein